MSRAVERAHKRASKEALRRHHVMEQAMIDESNKLVTEGIIDPEIVKARILHVARAMHQLFERQDAQR